MAIEDLPIIRAKDIHQKSPVVDRAEVTFDPFGVKFNPNSFERKLFLVLGRGKYRRDYGPFSEPPRTKIIHGIFVVTEMYHYGLARTDEPSDVGHEFRLSFKLIPLKSIGEYISLIPEKK